MAGEVLHRMPGEGDPLPPLNSLGQALDALGSGLRNDLASPAGGALHRAEEGDMPAAIAAALLAMAAEGDVLGRLLQAASDLTDFHAPNSYRHRRGECLGVPELVQAVRGIGRRWAMLAAGINELLAGAEEDATGRERALIELQAGRARVAEDGETIVAGAAEPAGKGKPGCGA